MDTNIVPGETEISKVSETFSLNWQGIEISLKWEPEYAGGLISHLEIKSKDAVPIPITNTGYWSHFCDREGVEYHG